MRSESSPACSLVVWTKSRSNYTLQAFATEIASRFACVNGLFGGIESKFTTLIITSKYQQSLFYGNCYNKRIYSRKFYILPAQKINLYRSV